jgi:two-component system, LytTR family, response regulator
MTIRTVVVDDEPLARARLVDLLAAEHDVEVIAECKDGPEAVAAIGRLSPDVVFLDVQMPAADAFQVLASLDSARLPLIIFVTAYEQHALKAFDVQATDYLLKPYDNDRFRHALDRARAQLEQKQRSDLATRLLEMATQTHLLQSDRVMVKSGNRVLFWRLGQIDWIESEGNYVRLHIGGESHLLRETMTALEARLDPARFMRIHRCRIVNVERIRKIEPGENGDYTLTLTTGAAVTLSRSYRARLDERFGSL